MALELLQIVGGLLVLLIPGILLAGAIHLGKSRLEQAAFGGTISLGIAAYLASAVSHLDLRLFYPLWAVFGVVAAILFWRQAKKPAEKSSWVVIFILLLVAVTRLAIALPMDLPNGWDPSFHMILARKIQLTQHAISDWTPFESIPLNYPTGSHTLIVVLAAISRLPLHVVFKDFLPLLGVLSTANIYLLARRATGNDVAANFSAAIYGLCAMDGSIDYFRWGGLPNELGMLLLIGMLAIWLNESAGRRAWILMAILYAGVILVHHHVMLASAGILCAAMIFPGNASRKSLFAALFAAAILDAFFLIPYALKITTLSSTFVLSHGEQIGNVFDSLQNMGWPVVILALVGLTLWIFRQSRCHPLILTSGLTLALMFVAGEYVWPIIRTLHNLDISTAFTPSRFLSDLNYYFCILAGMALAHLQSKLNIPIVVMSLIIPVSSLIEFDQWSKVAALDDATGNMVSPGYIRCCRWINQQTPFTTVVMNDDAWTSYFAWRRANHTPMPISEPWDLAQPEAFRAPQIISGRIPPDSADMEIVQIVDARDVGKNTVVWQDQGKLAVILLWQAPQK